MIDFVELRLYNPLGTTFSVLPNFSGLTFDVKYNEIGVLNFTYPLEESKAAALGDQSLIGVALGFDDSDGIDFIAID